MIVKRQWKLEFWVAGNTFIRPYDEVVTWQVWFLFGFLPIWVRRKSVKTLRL